MSETTEPTTEVTAEVAEQSTTTEVETTEPETAPASDVAASEVAAEPEAAPAGQNLEVLPDVEPLINPTIGRVVWFWSEEPQLSGVLPEAAIVTFVRNAFTVNLAVFGADGDTRPQLNVTLSNGQEVTGYPRAEWMPYQLANR